MDDTLNNTAEDPLEDIDRLFRALLRLRRLRGPRAGSIRRLIGELLRWRLAEFKTDSRLSRAA